MAPAPTPTSKRSGFSLIEVVIAIGIVAIILLPVVALLGSAIDTSREAFAKVNDARIGAELIGELQQAEWDEISTWDGKDIYFDYQGQRIPNGTQEDAVFTARIQLSTEQSGVNLGVQPSGGNLFLRQVLVAVSSRPGSAGALAIDRALAESSSRKPGVHFARAVLVNAER